MPPPLQLEIKLRKLEEGSLYAFTEWPNDDAVPHVAAGVYSIWQGSELIYVGMSGRRLSAEDVERKRKKGQAKKALYARLKSHASGRRSGDQFCICVCDRLVLPTLSREELEAIRCGDLSLDQLTRDYIHDHLGYRFAITWNGERARRVEREARRGALDTGKPFLNPL